MRWFSSRTDYRPFAAPSTRRCRSGHSGPASPSSLPCCTPSRRPSSRLAWHEASAPHAGGECKGRIAPATKIPRRAWPSDNTRDPHGARARSARLARGRRGREGGAVYVPPPPFRAAPKTRRQAKGARARRLRGPNNLGGEQGEVGDIRVKEIRRGRIVLQPDGSVAGERPPRRRRRPWRPMPLSMHRGVSVPHGAAPTISRSRQPAVARVRAPHGRVRAAGACGGCLDFRGSFARCRAGERSLRPDRSHTPSCPGKPGHDG